MILNIPRTRVTGRVTLEYAWPLFSMEVVHTRASCEGYALFMVLLPFWRNFYRMRFKVSNQIRVRNERGQVV